MLFYDANAQEMYLSKYAQIRQIQKLSFARGKSKKHPGENTENLVIKRD